MQIGTIHLTERFERGYRRLPQAIKEAAQRKETIFRENPFDLRLATHKLHGKDKEAWSFSVNRFYRIKFIFLTPQSVLFLEIGTHEIYR